MGGSPPHWVNRLLECLLSDDLAEPLVGDLLEEHALRTRSTGARSASSWYWIQVFGSAVPLLYFAFRHGRWVLAVSLGFTAYAVAEATIVAADVAMSQVLQPATVAHAGLILVVGLTTIVLAGYLAARIRPGAGVAFVLIVTLAGAVQLLKVTGGMPLWYELVFLIAGPLAAAAGGALSVTRRLRPGGEP
jgi:hypothetical protein